MSWFENLLQSPASLYQGLIDLSEKFTYLCGRDYSFIFPQFYIFIGNFINKIQTFLGCDGDLLGWLSGHDWHTRTSLGGLDSFFRLLSCLALFIGMYALLQDWLDIEPIFLEVDSFSLQIVIHNFLLLANYLGLARDFLEKNLHHVHLTQCKRVHLVVQLLGLGIVLRRF